jgi:hypothetical protein
MPSRAWQVLPLIAGAFLSTGFSASASESGRRWQGLANCMKTLESATKEERHDPFPLLRDYIYAEKYLTSFVGSMSHRETCEIMHKIHAEETDREIIAAAPLEQRIAATALALFLSPVILICSIFAGFAGLSFGRAVIVAGCIATFQTAIINSLRTVNYTSDTAFRWVAATIVAALIILMITALLRKMRPLRLSLNRKEDDPRSPT